MLFSYLECYKKIYTPHDRFSWHEFFNYIKKDQKQQMKHIFSFFHLLKKYDPSDGKMPGPNQKGFFEPP